MASTSAQQPSPAPQPTPPKTTPPAAGQQRPAPGDEDVVRITTNLVQIDAVVTDKNGKPVKDLRPEEVRISEDGRPQTVTNFSYIVADSSSSISPATRAAVTDKTAPPVPPVVLR